MGTSCLTIFNDSKHQEIAVLYTLYDGYMSGHGANLSRLMTGRKMVNGIGPSDSTLNSFNGPACLAAHIVSCLKKRIGDHYLFRAYKRNILWEYIYIINVELGKEAQITVFNCDNVFLYKGTATQMYSFCQYLKGGGR